MLIRKRTLTLRVRYRTPSRPRRPYDGSLDGAFAEEIMREVRNSLEALGLDDVELVDDREGSR